jgi:hypothetical protein
MWNLIPPFEYRTVHNERIFIDAVKNSSREKTAKPDIHICHSVVIFL